MDNTARIEESEQELEQLEKQREEITNWDIGMFLDYEPNLTADQFRDRRIAALDSIARRINEIKGTSRAGG
jgi:hypothetical protein